MKLVWIALMIALVGAPEKIAPKAPLDKAKLAKQAELVIVGDVQRIEPFGVPFKGRCNVWQHYRAAVAVRKISKGKTSSNVLKVKFLRKVRGVIRCQPLHVGADLQVGQRYELYLVPFQLKYGTVYGIVGGNGVVPVPKN